MGGGCPWWLVWWGVFTVELADEGVPGVQFRRFDDVAVGVLEGDWVVGTGHGGVG